jgi:hypothetical protein
MVGVPLSFGWRSSSPTSSRRSSPDVHRVERWAGSWRLVVAAAWIAIRAYRRSQALERETQTSGCRGRG